MYLANSCESNSKAEVYRMLHSLSFLLNSIINTSTRLNLALLSITEISCLPKSQPTSSKLALSADKHDTADPAHNGNNSCNDNNNEIALGVEFEYRKY